MTLRGIGPLASPQNSQFFKMAVAEEKFHVGRLEGTTSDILNDLWDPDRVIDTLQAQQPFEGNTKEDALDWAKQEFEIQLAYEEKRSELKQEALRCEVEREAKSKATPEVSHRLSLKCTHSDCIENDDSNDDKDDN